jgi:hypothetical protein
MILPSRRGMFRMCAPLPLSTDPGIVLEHLIGSCLFLRCEDSNAQATRSVLHSMCSGTRFASVSVPLLLCLFVGHLERTSLSLVKNPPPYAILFPTPSWFVKILSDLSGRCRHVVSKFARLPLPAGRQSIQDALPFGRGLYKYL